MIDYYSLCVSIINVFIIGYLGYLTNRNAKELKEIQEINANELKGIQEKSLSLHMAQTEIYIQELLVTARKMSNDAMIAIINNPNNEEKDKIKALMDNSLQEILNSYEVACMKYLDKKIDTERFKKTYIKEIRDLFNAGSPYLDKIYDTNSYQAIKKVNDEWNNLEKN